MAVSARIQHADGRVVLALYANEERQWISHDPDERNWGLYIYADHEKLDQGEYQIVGIEAVDVSDITDFWLQELDRLDLPRIEVFDVGLLNVTVADALRWARATYPSRHTRVTT